MFACPFAFAQVTDFRLFSLDVPAGYTTEEIKISNEGGYALILENPITQSNVTILYDALHGYSFADVFQQYAELYNPDRVADVHYVDGEGYVMEFVFDGKDANAYIFHEDNAYSMYIFSGYDSDINRAVNSLVWK